MDEPSVAEVRAAREELDEIVEEIQRLDGFHDFLAEPTFESVAEVAVEQPLVYLSPAELGGVALIVRSAGVTPLMLDRLTTAAVRDQVTGYVEAYNAFRADGGDPAARRRWRRAIDELTGWLWTDAMGPVLAELAGDRRAVIIAGGLLGLLPVHAAHDPDPAGGGRYALDALTLTFAPNARSLAGARELADVPATRAIAVADPTGTLTCAAGEAAMAVASFPDGGTVLAGSTAGPDQVAAALRDAEVAHFACHGYAVPTVPLDSGLELAGSDPLTLRAIFSLELRMRLVVLSACETLLPGTELPDEVVALPTGLLQAGVGGVVASLWRIDDLAALLVMTEFYRCWRWEQADPPEALRRAQLWMRDATNGEIVRRYEEALDEGAPWLPGDVAQLVLVDLKLEDPDRRKYSTIDAWAGFAYVGA